MGFHQRESRLRFTFAHEVGHLVLHKEKIQQCDFRIEDDWIHFREDFLEEDLFWFEQQAYEFAGRLLVPRQELIKELKKHQNKIHKFQSLINNEEDDILIQAISRVICDKFGVSHGVIYRRIRNERIWKALNL